MRIPADLVPQKVVAEDLCVSIVTLWRARHSGLPEFPKPVIRKNMVFWKKSELVKLEDALLQFKGRTKFEQQRRHAKRVAALTKQRAQPKRKKRIEHADTGQKDLF